MDVTVMGAAEEVIAPTSGYPAPDDSPSSPACEVLLQNSLIYESLNTSEIVKYTPRDDDEEEDIIIQVISSGEEDEPAGVSDNCLDDTSTPRIKVEIVDDEYENSYSATKDDAPSTPPSKGNVLVAAPNSDAQSFFNTVRRAIDTGAKKVAVNGTPPEEDEPPAPVVKRKRGRPSLKDKGTRDQPTDLDESNTAAAKGVDSELRERLGSDTETFGSTSEAVGDAKSTGRSRARNISEPVKIDERRPRKKPGPVAGRKPDATENNSEISEGDTVTPEKRRGRGRPVGSCRKSITAKKAKRATAEKEDTDVEDGNSDASDSDEILCNIRKNSEACGTSTPGVSVVMLYRYSYIINLNTLC